MDPKQEQDPARPPERTPDDSDGNEAPETPPTEPAPVPEKDPPNAPGKRGPYVVE